MEVFVLDFDGVLCDSAGETAVSAWRAAREVWPDWPGGEPDEPWIERFRRLRSVLETGYEAVVLARLMHLGLADASMLTGFRALCAALLEREGHGAQALTRVFGRVRDDWIARDPQGWLARQRCYPGVVQALAETLQRSPVFILTTKQERFVRTLLRSHGLALPDGALFGLDRGRLKEDILQELTTRAGLSGARFHFVEDRLATLERVAAREDIAGVRLYLAAWGYNTAEQRRRAAADPRITVWELASFLKAGALRP